MADTRLSAEQLTREHREFLERRAEERGTSVEEELGRVLDLAIALDAPESYVVTYNPKTGTVCHTPKNPTSIADFAGTIIDPDAAGKSFDDLLYGEEAEG